MEPAEKLNENIEPFPPPFRLIEDPHIQSLHHQIDYKALHNSDHNTHYTAINNDNNDNNNRNNNSLVCSVCLREECICQIESNVSNSTIIENLFVSGEFDKMADYFTNQTLKAFEPLDINLIIGPLLNELQNSISTNNNMNNNNSMGNNNNFWLNNNIRNRKKLREIFKKKLDKKKFFERKKHEKNDNQQKSFNQTLSIAKSLPPQSIKSESEASYYSESSQPPRATQIARPLVDPVTVTLTSTARVTEEGPVPFPVDLVFQTLDESFSTIDNSSLTNFIINQLNPNDLQPSQQT